MLARSKASLVQREVARRSRDGGIVALRGRPAHPASGTIPQAASRPALRARTPLSLRDISPHCGESPFTQGGLSAGSPLQCTFSTVWAPLEGSWRRRRLRGGPPAEQLHLLCWPIAKVATPHPLRGSSPQGEPSLSKNCALVCRACRGEQCSPANLTQ